MSELPAEERERILVAAGNLGRGLTAWAEAVQPAFQQFGRRLSEAFGMMSSPALDRLLHRLTLPRRHHRRCTLCNPTGNPRPMAGQFKPGPKATRFQGRRH